ncbi:MAG: DUF86 domain-containing protein [Thermodesulfovibrionales bacterium]|nr:DUF86 domain-containing protein [Thermodesulfovibrionales bacterium]
MLCENKIIPAAFFNKLKDMASFRNLMVHNYAKVDIAKVYGILKRHLKDLDIYLGYIVKFLEKDKAAERKRHKRI